jgi:hypothetical protein
VLVKAFPFAACLNPQARQAAISCLYENSCLKKPGKKAYLTFQHDNREGKRTGGMHHICFTELAACGSLARVTSYPFLLCFLLL